MSEPDENHDDDRMLPLYELDELVELFGYTNVRAVRRAIRLEIFPVPVFQLAGRTVAHIDAVDLFLKRKRQEAMNALKVNPE